MPDPKDAPAPVAPKLCLDDLLSLKPLKSDPIKVEYGGSSVDVCLQEVPNAHKNKLKAAAIQHIENDRRKREDAGDGEWRDAESDIDVLRAQEWDMRILHAAMRDPKTNGPAVSLEVLRHNLSSNLQEFMGEKYAEFENGLNIDGATDEMIKSLIDDVKKKGDLALLWTQYGSLTALRCVQSLVVLLETYQIDPSTGISSGELKPSNTPES